MKPIAWAWRRHWRQLVTGAARHWPRHKKTARHRRQARVQLRCPACLLFIRDLCDVQPDPCGLCPACCPGHRPKEPQR